MYVQQCEVRPFYTQTEDVITRAPVVYWTCQLSEDSTPGEKYLSTSARTHTHGKVCVSLYNYVNYVCTFHMTNVYVF